VPGLPGGFGLPEPGIGAKTQPQRVSKQVDGAGLKCSADWEKDPDSMKLQASHLLAHGHSPQSKRTTQNRDAETREGTWERKWRLIVVESSLSRTQTRWPWKVSLKQKPHTLIQTNPCCSDRKRTFRADNTGRDLRLLAQDQVLSVVKQTSDPTFQQSNLQMTSDSPHDCTQRCPAFKRRSARNKNRRRTLKHHLNAQRIKMNHRRKEKLLSLM